MIDMICMITDYLDEYFFYEDLFLIDMLGICDSWFTNN